HIHCRTQQGLWRPDMNALQIWRAPDDLSRLATGLFKEDRNRSAHQRSVEGLPLLFPEGLRPRESILLDLLRRLLRHGGPRSAGPARIHNRKSRRVADLLNQL